MNIISQAIARACTLRSMPFSTRCCIYWRTNMPDHKPGNNEKIPEDNNIQPTKIITKSQAYFQVYIQLQHGTTCFII